jgi:hypothetical protein
MYLVHTEISKRTYNGERREYKILYATKFIFFIIGNKALFALKYLKHLIMVNGGGSKKGNHPTMI